MKHISRSEIFSWFTDDDLRSMTTAAKETARQMKDREKLQSRRTRGLTMVIAVEKLHPRIRRTLFISSKK